MNTTILLQLKNTTVKNVTVTYYMFCIEVVYFGLLDYIQATIIFYV